MQKTFTVEYPEFNPENEDEVKTAHSIALSNFIGSGIESGLFQDNQIYNQIENLSLNFNYFLTCVFEFKVKHPIDCKMAWGEVLIENEVDDESLKKSLEKIYPDEVLI